MAAPGKILSLDDINAVGAGQTGFVFRVRAISGLIPDIFTRPPEAGYDTRKAVNFTQADFLSPFLDADELRRLNGFRALKKQVEWCCGRHTAKTLIQAHLMPDRPLTGIRILYRDLGAPYAKDAANLSLTLSHSRDLTAAALSLSPGLTLGLDIEAIGKMPDKAFMKTAFTPKEINTMEPTPLGVFHAWTLKEAYLKYICKGFNESLHKVEVVENRIFHNGATTDVETRSWHLSPGYMLSLVKDN